MVLANPKNIVTLSTFFLLTGVDLNMVSRAQRPDLTCTDHAHMHKPLILHAPTTLTCTGP